MLVIHLSQTLKCNFTGGYPNKTWPLGFQLPSSCQVPAAVTAGVALRTSHARQIEADPWFLFLRLLPCFDAPQKRLRVHPPYLQQGLCLFLCHSIGMRALAGGCCWGELHPAAAHPSPLWDNNKCPPSGKVAGSKDLLKNIYFTCSLQRPSSSI